MKQEVRRRREFHVGVPLSAHAGTWPHSGDVIARDFKGGPEDVKAEMIGENAAKLDGLVA